MTDNHHLPTDKNSQTYTRKQSLSASNHLFTMLAACAGVVVGVFGSMGYVTTSIHSQMASDTAALSHQISNYKTIKTAAVFTADGTDPSASSNQCLAPSEAGGGGGAGGGGMSPAAVLGASTTGPSGGSGTTGGGGGGGGSGSSGGTTNNFVHKLVSGIFSPETATISNTGPDSINKVLFQNTVDTTVTNTNKINVTNNNAQTATSGSSSVEQNTTGGAATTGDATNTSNTTVTANVTN